MVEEIEVMKKATKAVTDYINNNDITVKDIPQIQLVQFEAEGKRVSVHYNQLHKTELVLNRLYKLMGAL